MGAKRVYLTLNDELMKDLEIWADIESRPLANMVTVLVERAIKKAKADGVLPTQPQQPPNFKEEAFSALDALLTKLAGGGQPSNSEITYAAMHTTIGVDKLKAICDRLHETDG